MQTFWTRDTHLDWWETKVVQGGYFVILSFIPF